MLRRIFASKGEETPREWKKIHNEQLHNIKMDLKEAVLNIRLCSDFSWLNETSRSLKDREYVGQLNNYELLKMGSIP